MSFATRIRPHVNAEIGRAKDLRALRRPIEEFACLERAHVLGQAATVHHVRVHALMLAWALRHQNLREAMGQLLRIVGAATKTALGLVPKGNTGGANVSPFKPLPVPEDLQAVLHTAQQDT